MKNITLLLLLMMLTSNIYGQDKGVGMEMKVGLNVQSATNSERELDDISTFKIFEQRIRPRLGAYVSLEAVVPISKKWDFNSGLLVSYSSYKQLMKSNLKYGTGGSNGQFVRHSEVHANVNIIELGVPVTFYYKFSKSKIGLSLDARYLFSPSVDLIIYEGGVEAGDASIRNDGLYIKNKNFATGLSYINYPFYSQKLKNVGWGIDVKYFLLKNKLYLSETETNRIITNFYLVFKLK